MTTTAVLQVLGQSAGGIARHVAQVVEALDGRDGLSVDVAGPNDLPIPIPKRIATVAIPRGPVRGHRAAVRELRRLLDRGGYEVVHAHGLRAGIDSGLAARAVGVPVVTTVHNLVRPEIAGVVRARLYRRAEAAAVRLSDRVLAVSEQIADHLRSTAPHHGAVEKVETLHLGIGGVPAVTKDAGEVRTLLALGEGDRLVVTASRLSAQKAVHVLLSATARLRAPVVVAILGEGPLEAELRTLASSLGIEDRVRFLGFRSDVADFIAAADVFCLASIWEGVPLAAQEAILLGTPVVATRVGGMAELVTDRVSGRLVPAGDPTALATAVDETLSSPELRAGYAAAARRDLERNFSTEAMLERLAALYRGGIATRA